MISRLEMIILIVSDESKNIIFYGKIQNLRKILPLTIFFVTQLFFIIAFYQFYKNY